MQQVCPCLSIHSFCKHLTLHDRGPEDMITVSLLHSHDRHLSCWRTLTWCSNGKTQVMAVDGLPSATLATSVHPLHATSKTVLLAGPHGPHRGHHIGSMFALAMMPLMMNRQLSNFKMSLSFLDIPPRQSTKVGRPDTESQPAVHAGCVIAVRYRTF